MFMMTEGAHVEKQESQRMVASIFQSEQHDNLELCDVTNNAAGDREPKRSIKDIFQGILEPCAFHFH